MKLETDLFFYDLVLTDVTSRNNEPFVHFSHLHNHNREKVFNFLCKVLPHNLGFIPNY